MYKSTTTFILIHISYLLTFLLSSKKIYNHNSQLVYPSFEKTKDKKNKKENLVVQPGGPKWYVNAQKKMPDNFVIDGFFRLFFVLCSLKFGVKRLPREHGDCDQKCFSLLVLPLFPCRGNPISSPLGCVWQSLVKTFFYTM